jgi:hypothetical protein
VFASVVGDLLESMTLGISSELLEDSFARGSHCPESHGSVFIEAMAILCVSIIVFQDMHSMAHLLPIGREVKASKYQSVACKTWKSQTRPIPRGDCHDPAYGSKWA